MRTTTQIEVDSIEAFNERLLHWAQNGTHCIWMDSNNHNSGYTQYDAILAVGAHSKIESASPNAFTELEQFIESLKDWVFGYLTYDLKNSIEDLSSNNFDELEFPELCFFQPKKLFLIEGNNVKIQYLAEFEQELQSDLVQINNTPEINSFKHDPPKIKMRIHKDAYFDKVNTLLEHIHRGDIYEANFCQEFYAEEIELFPIATYKHLNSISRPPFSTFLRFEDKYLLSATPERFIKREGRRIISQPIKGTARRSSNPDEDHALKEALVVDEKERSENIMIVDLVRNDLSQTAKAGTVKVTELCKVYSFMQVHQMISTIESEMRADVSGIEVIKQAFPMGSMTGAPKISAMKIIEELEETKRGLYSGSVGYFKPNGDFDFNVVIRSILYNATKKYASFSVGSAITSKSHPQTEYEECLLKAKAMREVLEN
ncbi:anthranilate synthase component I family protein [Winogradskyella aurantiaca]|uniref:anthranilate synthase component I family protein n=1 Tax=Winogradskyella aurantiaca TaxID=2219558 RepID=UPI001E4C7051|nr:anthranilate synthase component I family protein [Winogradskyella aurantiaca]